MNKDTTKKKVLKPEDAISRYRCVLKAVSRGMSKTDAYSYAGVNRKTIVDTAAIAELKALDPGKYFQIRAMFHKGKKGHTL
ncbi:coiled-coil domain-containing protein 106-like [Astyanax mexicanus]|uniref:Coiled-coil domain-containing protein 106-like n=1 Tax=Astyanax mexicanus TaxID=7994 RepID=A0A8T2MB44_ASTMX|nr:coiled-coil domain-containing protein 106-like [Astyanax mexicanus]